MILNSPYITGSITVTGNANIQGQLTVTGSLSGTASLASNSLLLEGTGSTGFATTSSLLAVSSSQQQISASLLSLTASYNALSSSYTALSASYNVASSSFSTRITSDSSSLSSRTTQIENVYATTGSNSFTGVQNFSNTCTPNSFTAGASLYTAGGLRVTQDAYFSSSVYIKGNVTVYGTQSVAYISSSQLDIGTNIITVNTATPSIRYGGLSVFDSGSTGLTGSILWDSELNRWIYSNASGSGGGATYGGGMFISGPRNSQGIGCEQGTTACMLLVGQGGDHLTSSMIYHDSTVTCIPNTLAGGIINSSISTTSTACSTLNLISGCVGIGGINPSNPLHIYTNVNGPSTAIKIHNGSACAGATTGIEFQLLTDYCDYKKAEIRAVAASSYANNIDLAFWSGGSTVNAHAERMRIFSTGETCFACTVCVPNIISTGVSGGRYATFGAPTNGGYITFEAGGSAFGDLGSYCAQYGTGDATTLLLGSRTGYALALGTNSTERLRITSGGNVGIGTTSPCSYASQTLHVNSPSGVSTSIKVTNTTTTTGVACGLDILQSNSDTYIYNRSVGLIELGTSNAARLTISSAGVACFSNTVCVGGTLTLGNAGVTNAVINSADGMYLNIDSDGSGSTPEFMFGKGRSGAGSGGTTFMTIANSGCIGINTTSPCALLHISTPSAACILWPAILNNPYNDGIAGYGVGLRLQNSTIAGAQETHKWAGIAAVAGGSSGYSNDTDLAFYVGCFIAASNCTCPPVEKMRIKSSTGNVGIGTNNPSALLHLSQNASNLNLYLQNINGNGKTWALNSDTNGNFNIHDTSNNRLTITCAGVVLVGTTTNSGYGVLNTYKAPVSNNYVDQLIIQGTGNYPSLRLGTFDAYDAVIATTGNDLRILSGLNVTTENHNIKFYTSFNGGTTGAQNYERMRIEYNGAVLINTTSIPSNTRFYTALGDVEGFRFGNWQSYTYTTNNAWVAENTWFDGNFKRLNSGYAYALYSDAASGMQMRVAGTSSINSTIAWLNAVTALPNGDVRNYNNSTTWQQSSDIKIKQNIRPISNVLDKITALNPTHFEFKNKPGITKTGFIAQEFEQVFPGHVRELEPMSEYKEYFEEGEMLKTIDADLIPYLVKAIQELKAENDIFKTCLGIS